MFLQLEKMVTQSSDFMPKLSAESIIYMNEVLDDCEKYLSNAFKSKNQTNESVMFLYEKLIIAIQSCINCNFDEDKNPSSILKLEIFSFILLKYFRKESVFSLKNINYELIVLLSINLNPYGVCQVIFKLDLF
jgi:hypothetical protein